MYQQHYKKGHLVSSPKANLGAGVAFGSGAVTEQHTFQQLHNKIQQKENLKRGKSASNKHGGQSFKSQPQGASAVNTSTSQSKHQFTSVHQSAKQSLMST